MQHQGAQGPTARTLEIASVLASGATIADVVLRYDLSPQRARQIRKQYVGEGKVGRPRLTGYAAHSAVGREFLGKVAVIAVARGWEPADLLAWIDAELPKKV